MEKINNMKLNENAVFFERNVIFVFIVIIYTVQKGLAEDCYLSNDGIPVYTGTVNTTATGILCQRWDVVQPHRPLYPMGPEHKNYCRSPDNDTKVWCYTTNASVEWEFCDVPACDITTQIITGSTRVDSGTTDPSVTTTITTVSVTDPASTSVLSSNTNYNTANLNNTCLCACDSRTQFWINFFQSNLTDEEKNAILEDEKERLKNILMVDKTELTSYVRAHTSARDDRPSAMSFGVAGIVVLALVFGFIILLDAVTYCPKMVNRTKKIVKRIKKGP